MSDELDDDRPSKRLKRDVAPVAHSGDSDDDDDGDDGGEDEEVDEDEEGGGGVIGKDGKKTKGKGGSSCHQCKSRRNFTALTYCTSNLDKNKKCRKKFCGHCLKKFYKEQAQAITDKSGWKCPSCRKICCCAACRRRKTKDIGKDEPSPIQKVKKPPSSHKSSGQHYGESSSSSGRQRRENTNYHPHAAASHHHDSDVLYHPPGSNGGHGEDEGYPPSSHHRRGDRSLLHNSHSPRMSGHEMSDSPERNFDMISQSHQSGRGRRSTYQRSHQQQQSDDHDGDEYSEDQQPNYSEDDSDGGDDGGDGVDDHGSDGDGADDDIGGATQNIHSLGAQSYMHDDDPSTSLPSSQFTTLLSQHIKTLAEESSRTPNSPFARLYKQAQQLRIKKKIKAILMRPDIKKEKKVELIAALLAPLEEQGPEINTPNNNNNAQSTPMNTTM